MEVKRKMFIFILILIAMFSITSVCSSPRGHGHGGHGHGGHGHGGHGHASHGSSSHGGSSSVHASGDSSSGHASGGSSSVHASSDSSSVHASGGSSSGHASHGDSSLGSHPIDGQSSSHVEPSGLNHHNSQSEPDSPDHHNSDTQPGGYDSSDGHVNDDNPHAHHRGHSNNHHHNNHHKPGRRERDHESTTTSSPTTTPAPKIDESWLDLSCDNKLPKFMGNKYPRKRIAAAVREMKKILSADSGNSAIRSRIKYEVKEYFYMLNKPYYGDVIDHSTGCEEVTSYIAPLGGCDISGTPFIVVNVPGLAQVIKTSNCSTFTFCNYSDGSMCLQSKRRQELLVLPVKQGSFNVTDFSVGTFKVHNGCQCLSGDQIDINNIHDFLF